MSIEIARSVSTLPVVLGRLTRKEAGSRRRHKRPSHIGHDLPMRNNPYPNLSPVRKTACEAAAYLVGAAFQPESNPANWAVHQMLRST